MGVVEAQPHCSTEHLEQVTHPLAAVHASRPQSIKVANASCKRLPEALRAVCLLQFSAFRQSIGECKERTQLGRVVPAEKKRNPATRRPRY